MTIDQDQLAATLADARAKAEAALSPDDRWQGMSAHVARMDPATTLLLLDAVKTLQAENERLRPVCSCYPDGFSYGTFEGPQEDCPAHGRPYDEVWEIASANAFAFTNEKAAREAAEAEAADIRTRLANVRALADDLFARAPDQRTDQWHARLEVARDILRALDGPQDGTPAEQQVADLAGLTVADVRDVGGLPQDGGEGR